MGLQRIETRVCSIVNSVTMSTDMTDGMSTLIASSFFLSHLTSNPSANPICCPHKTVPDCSSPLPLLSLWFNPVIFE